MRLFWFIEQLKSPWENVCVSLNANISQKQRSVTTRKDNTKSVTACARGCRRKVTLTVMISRILLCLLRALLFNCLESLDLSLVFFTLFRGIILHSSFQSIFWCYWRVKKEALSQSLITNWFLHLLEILLILKFGIFKKVVMQMCEKKTKKM